MSTYFERSLTMHENLHGKIGVKSKFPIETLQDLSIAYTPGVARPCEVIAKDPKKARTLTLKRNSVAVVSDGSAVLGLGNIGPLAAIPVMEGKAILFKQYADIDAWPICLNTQDTDEIIRTIENISPVFGGINLEDIAAPRCFEIEARLQDLGIPVFHDDQHGTAIVLLAALLNACRVLGKNLCDLKVVINGAGAAGTAIAQLLCGIGYDSDKCTSVKDAIICDSKGSISTKRQDLSPEKRAFLAYTNSEDRDGSIQDVIEGMDVFVGVSKGGLLTSHDIKRMAKGSIVMAMANSVPEIMPDEAYKGGAAIVGTGRSDLPNQVNNVLAFPGIFRGALDANAPRITPNMKLAAAYALSKFVSRPTEDHILPSPLNRQVAFAVAAAVKEVALREMAEAVLVASY